MVKTSKSDKMGVINQLHSMLTNHPERMHSKLDVYLINSKDNYLIAKEAFEIYTNHPIDKIKDKVEKLKLKGGIYTLSIMELVEKAAGEYLLILAI